MLLDELQNAELLACKPTFQPFSQATIQSDTSNQSNIHSSTLPKNSKIYSQATIQSDIGEVISPISSSFLSSNKSTMDSYVKKNEERKRLTEH
ncbi:hypothetical protein RCL1_007057 [Eukaryota sp. TZLM3-RCL]